MSHYLTAELPGTGGLMRQQLEDFQVWELPAYEPCQEGSHRYLELTKRGDSTPFAVERLARALGISGRDIGYAGLKDRHAVTTQRLSIPASVPLESLLELEDVRDLGLHTNKLRRGHLRANRFQVRVREVGPAGYARALAIAERLRGSGWPNYYGGQRFGHGENVELGRRMIAGERMKMAPWKRDLMVASVQSDLFNRYLSERIERGDFSRVLPGDVCAHLPQGGMFVGTPETEQPRVDAFEISVTGPIFGYKMWMPEERAGELERALLASAGLELASFKGVGAPGSRRRFRLSLEELAVQAEGEDLIFTFVLPAGSYATVLIDEFIKSGELAEEQQDPAA